MYAYLCIYMCICILYLRVTIYVIDEENFAQLTYPTVCTSNYMSEDMYIHIYACIYVCYVGGQYTSTTNRTSRN